MALGGDVPALVARLQTAEQRRKQLLRQTWMLLDGPSFPRVDGRSTERHARERLHTWPEIFRLNVEAARPLLRELLEDRKIHFTPITEADRRGYEFEGMPQRAAC